MKPIYLDWSATAPICSAAKQAIIDHIDDYGNPSSAHEFGHKSLMLIEDARERIANCINASPDEIYFTSGGSEANTWALSHYASVSSKFEHHSVKAHYAEIGVSKDGFVDPQSFSLINHRLSKLFELASCMYVNNELGTVQSIKDIAKIVRSKNMLFHTDAVQAVGHIPIDVKDLDCDMLSASGHKFFAPKGTGFLFVKNGVGIKPIINGGKQEQGLRPGTENILGIISMAAALEDSVANMEERNEHIKILRDKLLAELLSIDGVRLNGSLENRVVSNINICIDGVRGSTLVAMCSLHGICISSGSACNEGEATPSHVLKAIGLSDEDALNSIRITLGYKNTMEEIEYAASIITQLIKRVRNS